MYRFYINNIENDYHYAELARVFLADDEFEVIGVSIPENGVTLTGNSYIVNRSGSDDREEIKREFFRILSDLTGRDPGWGTLTGVRPLKLAYEMLHEAGSQDGMEKLLRERYLVSPAKISLLREIVEYQMKAVSGDPSSMAGLYIGIPFCPTRCEYCAFASNVASEQEIEKYFDDLLKEISYTGRLVREHGTCIESIYIGGGTPTTLNPDQLRRLISAVSEDFGTDPASVEFTVEAGRPDTITADKLKVMRDLGVSRISINPQSMKDETLRLIGRDHTADDIRRGYALASEYDFDVINADLIAGLPGEDEEDFRNSLEEILSIGANNITVHTLSVKRGSRLREHDPDYYRRDTDKVSGMVDYARERLRSAGFVPYYIYRQKHQMGALENVGYCRPGQHSIYNIRIMEEKQTIIALGAGGIGKVYYPDEDRLERVANVSNYKIYSERFDEILERKDNYYK